MAPSSAAHVCCSHAVVEPKESLQHIADVYFKVKIIIRNIVAACGGIQGKRRGKRKRSGKGNGSGEGSKAKPKVNIHTTKNPGPRDVGTSPRMWGLPLATGKLSVECKTLVGSKPPGSPASYFMGWPHSKARLAAMVMWQQQLQVSTAAAEARVHGVEGFHLSGPNPWKSCTGRESVASQVAEHAAVSSGSSSRRHGCSAASLQTWGPKPHSLHHLEQAYTTLKLVKGKLR